jgi:two-component system LytT family response regulator
MPTRPDMQSIGAVIVDDEPLALENLRVLLEQDAQIRILSQCRSGQEALAAIRAHKPDLLFLDVEMPECDGFDVVEQLGGAAPAGLVFVTAFDHYALRAFDSGAIDYLQKPFHTERFRRALQRAKGRISERRGAAVAFAERWIIKTAGQVLVVPIADIDWIESADYYVSLHVGARTHLLRRSMAEVSAELEERHFCRIHRQAIVNLERIGGLGTNEDGQAVVVLFDGSRLPLSRRFRRGLLDRLAPSAAGQS